MTYPDDLRKHGDEVIVLDNKGSYELRGVIVGVHRCNPPCYDIDPNRAESLSRRLCSVPESRLRSVRQEVRAYERRDCEPKVVRDEA